VITLPFPPSSLSGHAKGNWHKKAAVTKQHRQWAHLATKLWLRENARDFGYGDIRVLIQFTPPDNRSDRSNFPIRAKSYLDGVADALGVNDRRFVPSFEFLPPAKPGSVRIALEAAQ